MAEIIDRMELSTDQRVEKSPYELKIRRQL